MKRAFKYDNQVFQVISTIFDCFVLGVLWIVTSLPIFTIGASSAALYYTINKTLKNNKGYVFNTYLEAFKSNFKQATLTWLIYLVLFAFLLVDLALFKNSLGQESNLGAMYYFFLIIFGVILAWVFYLFPYISRFECGFREAMFKSFAFMISNIGWSVLLVVIAYALFYICNDLQFLFLLLPGGFGYIQSIILEKIFNKYRSAEDILREKNIEN